MLEQEFASARQTFDAVLEKMPRDGTIGLVHDVDADGVTAGVVWQRVLERLGFRVARLSSNRERNVWTESNRALISAVQPDFLWVLDLGCRDEKVLQGVPTAFLDHHRPEGVLARRYADYRLRLARSAQHFVDDLRTGARQS